MLDVGFFYRRVGRGDNCDSLHDSFMTAYLGRGGPDDLLVVSEHLQQAGHHTLGVECGHEVAVHTGGQVIRNITAVTPCVKERYKGENKADNDQTNCNLFDI